MALNTFKCPYCDKQFLSYKSVSYHSSRTHKISNEQFIADFYHDGVIPKCKCGCGNNAPVCSSDLTHKGMYFGQWIRGHISKVRNNFNTLESILNSANTRRLRFASGLIVQ